MKTFKLTAFVRNVLALLLFTGALLAVVPVYFAPAGYVVQAACVYPGRPSFVNGVLVCDCTAIEHVGNCGCVVECPKDPADAPVSGGDS
jgi:hypothetical protein